MHSRQAGALSALLAACTVALLTVLAAPAGAFTTLSAGQNLPIWKTLLDDSVCGSHSADNGQPYRACRIRFAGINQLGTHSGWKAAAGAGAVRWCTIIDGQTGVADLCYVDYTNLGGISGHGIEIDASDQGGADAMGMIQVGYETATLAYVDPNSSYNRLQTAKVFLNHNPAVPWYVNSSTSAYTVPSGKVDMQTVVVHEMGHGLGLGHPVATGTSTAPVMACTTGYGYTNYGKTDDGQGDRWLYGGFNSALYGSPSSTNPC